MYMEMMIIHLRQSFIGAEILRALGSIKTDVLVSELRLSEAKCVVINPPDDSIPSTCKIHRLNLKVVTAPGSPTSEVMFTLCPLLEQGYYKYVTLECIGLFPGQLQDKIIETLPKALLDKLTLSTVK